MATTSAGGAPRSAWGPGKSERREVLRRNVVDSHLVTVDLAFQTGALLLDLSEAGIGVQALASAPAGDTTSLLFELPETGGRIEGLGRIAWTDTSGRLGIRFEQLAEPSRVHLEQWLSRERRPLTSTAVKGATPAWPPAHLRDEIAALRRDLVTQKMEGDEALAFVAERIHNVTRATGVAIALEENGLIVCRASSGNAPGIGAHVDPNSGLSGECVRTGEIVRCEDTETDPRADRLVCRKLELRSIVIVPIRIQGRSAGVLEAFSSRAHAFQSNDVLLLRRVTDLVAGIAVRQLDAAHTAPAGPHAVMAATELEPLEPLGPLEQMENPEQVIESDTAPLMMEDILALEVFEEIAPAPREHPVFPVARPAKAETPADEIPIFQTEKPAETISSLLAAAEPAEAAPISETKVKTAPVSPEIAKEEPAIEAETEAARPVLKVTPFEPERAVAPVFDPEEERPVRSSADPRPVQLNRVPVITAAAAPAIFPAKPRPVPVKDFTIKAAESAAAADRVWLDVAEETLPLWRNKMAIGAAVLAVLLLITGWQVWRVVTAPKSAPAAAAAEVKPPAPVPPADLTGTPNSTAPGNTTPAPVVTKPVPVSATPAPPRIPPRPSPSQAPPSDDVTVTRVAAPATASATPANNGSAPPPAPAPAKTAPAKPDEGPPTIGQVSRLNGNSMISSVLSAPVAAPSLAKPQVSKITGGRLIQRVEPVYPSAAMGIVGEVVLKAIVAKDGRVKSVKVVSGHAVLAQAAAAAIKRWRYEPFVLNGVPIEVENSILVNFKNGR